MLTLNVVAKGETEKGLSLAVGDVVEYCAHLGGQAVRIKFPNGDEDVAHPLCFKELR